MKEYLSSIRVLQEALLIVGIGVLLILPILLAYVPESIPATVISYLFTISLVSVTFVMSIRPLADLLPGVSWVRPLVILRKGFGVLSASIIVAMLLSKVMVSPGAYILQFLSPSHWSLIGGAIFSPLGDVSAVILLVTSNKFSKRVLGQNWKRIQKLAYVYFYAGALYELLVYKSTFALIALMVVTVLVLAAFVVNRNRTSV